MKILDYLKISDYWLKGKLNKPMQCKKSNLFRLFSFLDSQFNDIIDYVNRIYLSIYPCYPFYGGNELIKNHELELGIPDNLFRQITKDELYQFTYIFPIPFRDGDNESEELNLSAFERQKDIFTKKYLMNDNSHLGFKRVAGCYGYSIEIKTDYAKENDKFTYTLPLPFGGSLGGIETKITVYGNPTIKDRYKLNSIFNYMNRIDINLNIEFSDDDNIYNPKDYCLCEKF